VTAKPLDAARDALIALQSQLIAPLAAAVRRRPTRFILARVQSELLRERL